MHCRMRALVRVDGVVDAQAVRNASSNLARLMESHANGKQPLAAELPQPPPSSSPPKPRVSFSPDVAVVDGGAGDESGGSCSTKASPRQSTGEGGRSPARGSAGEASRPQVGLGIGDFAVMGKLGEGGYGTVHP